MPRMKAGQELRSLDTDTLSRIVVHPLQRANVGRVEELLGWLDSCTSAGELYAFQGELFRAIFEIETRRAACSKAAKRLRSGKGPQADAPDPAGGDLGDPATWQIEILVCERVARQLRCVGDGLAWKVFEYDRRFIIALSHNRSPGPLFPKEGLEYELGCVVDLWRNENRFGLLHDLTTCLRIADITEFAPNNRHLLHEVKKSGSATPAQKAQAQAAVDAIMDGGVLPGKQSDARLQVLSTRFQTDMGPLQDALALARVRGFQGVRLQQGRMLFAASLIDMQRLSGGDIEGTISALASARASAIRRAQLDQATHHLVGNSGDTAGRSPTAAPLSIFPLEPADRADLICDQLTFETVISVDVLANLLRDQGLHVEVLFPERNQRVPQDADVLRVRYEDRSMRVHAPAMRPLMFELLRPSSWCEAVVESLRLFGCRIRRSTPSSFFAKIAKKDSSPDIQVGAVATDSYQW